MTHAARGLEREPSPLTDLGVLLATGADARSFLQGQLSADLDELSPARALLASCNSAQGRVQAVLWIVERTDGLALVLPAALMEPIAGRLRKYILRAKAKIATTGLIAAVVPQSPAVFGLGPEPLHAQHDAVSFIALPGHRSTLIVQPAGAPTRLDEAANVQWRRERIAAGLPQIYPPTYETFVAQMLNLDALGGVSFSKGCYTGQEIIARAHYRGAVKRRMFRYAANDAPPPPGTRIAAGDQHAGEVVEAVDASTGCELLAVVSLGYVESNAALSLPSGASLSRLALPYQV